MMSIRTCPAALLLFINVCVICGTVISAPAQEIRIVVPNELEDVEGNVVLDQDASPNGNRSQEVFPASEFAALPPSHRAIIGLRWRPDKDAVPASFSEIDSLVRLSTTAKDPEDLSLTFAENVGPDETIVFEGPITYVTDVTGPADGPKDFDIALDFERPFIYDPSSGNNLLLDVKNAGPREIIPFDSHDLFGTSLVGSLDSEATEAVGRIEGFVTEFVFVPEPSSLAMGLLAMICLHWFRSGADGRVRH